MSAQTESASRTSRRAAADSPLYALDKAVLGVRRRYCITLGETLHDTEFFLRLVREAMGRPQYWQLAEIAMGRPHANVDPLVALFKEPPSTMWERLARIAAAAIVLRMQELAQRTPLHGSARLTYNSVGGQAQWTSERSEYDIYLGVMQIDVEDTVSVPATNTEFELEIAEKEWYVDLWASSNGAVMVYYDGDLAKYGLQFTSPLPVRADDMTDNAYLLEARRRFADKEFRPAKAPAFTA